MLSVSKNFQNISYSTILGCSIVFDLKGHNVAELPIPVNKEMIHSFCKKYHIHRLALFGSILTTSFSPSSDVDVLVQFDVKHIPSLFEIVDIESELSSIIGRKVDLKTPNDLSPHFRNEVVSNAKIIYG